LTNINVIAITVDPNIFGSTTKLKVTRNKFENICLKYGIYLFFLHKFDHFEFEDYTRQAIIIRLICNVQSRLANYDGAVLNLA